MIFTSLESWNSHFRNHDFYRSCALTFLSLFGLSSCSSNSFLLSASCSKTLSLSSGFFSFGWGFPSAFLCSVVRQNLQRLYLLRGSWLEIQQNIRSSGRWLTSSRHAEILYEKPIHRTFQLYMILSHRPPYMRKAEISCFSNKGGRHLQMYLHFSFRERLQIRRKRWEVLISSPFPALLWHCFR